MAVIEYKPGTAFPGVIGRTVDESSAAWPQPLRAKEGTPKVVYIVLDDLRFGQLEGSGVPIRTPDLVALAAGAQEFFIWGESTRALLISTPSSPTSTIPAN